jgi:hypothetical protein
MMDRMAVTILKVLSVDWAAHQTPRLLVRCTLCGDEYATSGWYTHVMLRRGCRSCVAVLRNRTRRRVAPALLPQD